MGKAWAPGTRLARRLGPRGRKGEPGRAPSGGLARGRPAPATRLLLPRPPTPACGAPRANRPPAHTPKPPAPLPPAPPPPRPDWTAATLIRRTDLAPGVAALTLGIEASRERVPLRSAYVAAGQLARVRANAGVERLLPVASAPPGVAANKEVRSGGAARLGREGRGGLRSCGHARAWPAHGAERGAHARRGRLPARALRAPFAALSAPPAAPLVWPRPPP